MRILRKSSLRDQNVTFHWPWILILSLSPSCSVISNNYTAIGQCHVCNPKSLNSSCKHILYLFNCKLQVTDLFHGHRAKKYVWQKRGNRYKILDQTLIFILRESIADDLGCNVPSYYNLEALYSFVNAITRWVRSANINMSLFQWHGQSYY